MEPTKPDVLLVPSEPTRNQTVVPPVYLVETTPTQRDQAPPTKQIVVRILNSLSGFDFKNSKEAFFKDCITLTSLLDKVFEGIL